MPATDKCDRKRVPYIHCHPWLVKLGLTELQVFSQLEGRNMFMIQTVQDAEHNLEAARAAQAEARETLGSQVAQLQRQVEDMETAVAAAADKCVRLQVS